MLEVGSPFPSFFVLGAPCSGSVRFVKLLRELPSVHVPSADPGFFAQHYERGARWYRERIGDPGNANAVGDHSTIYLGRDVDRDLVAARMDGLLPDLRLVAVVRDPVERAHAAFTRLVAAGRIPPDTDLVDHLGGRDPSSDPHRLIAAGRYGRNLLPFVHRFDGRLRLFDHRALIEHPTSTLTRAAEHLDIPLTTDPSNELPRGPADRSVPEEVRSALEEWFHDDLRLLEQTTGFSFSHARTGGNG